MPKARASSFADHLLISPHQEAIAAGKTALEFGDNGIGVWEMSRKIC